MVAPDLVAEEEPTPVLPVGQPVLVAPLAPAAIVPVVVQPALAVLQEPGAKPGQAAVKAVAAQQVPVEHKEPAEKKVRAARRRLVELRRQGELLPPEAPAAAARVVEMAVVQAAAARRVLVVRLAAEEPLHLAAEVRVPRLALPKIPARLMQVVRMASSVPSAGVMPDFRVTV